MGILYQDRMPGMRSYFLLDGVTIPITKATPKVIRAMGDTTDNGDYSQAADIIGPTQIPISAKVEMGIEGRYRRTVTPAAIVALLFSGATQIPCVLGLDQTLIWGHGLADISDFTTEDEIEGIITFTCSVISNGLWVPNG
jgi:hypothetical protein